MPTTFLDQDDFPRAANMPAVAGAVLASLMDFRMAYNIFQLTDLPSIGAYAEDMAKRCYENGRHAVVPLVSVAHAATICFDIIGDVESGHDMLQGILSDSQHTFESAMRQLQIKGALLRGGQDTFCGVGVYGTKHEKILFIAFDVSHEDG